MRSADKSLRKEQARYKRNFDARLRKPKYYIPSGSYVFLRKEQGTGSEPKHKLAQVATGPYQVRTSDQHTVVIAIGDQEERVSRNRVELAPSPMEPSPILSLRQGLQFLGGSEEVEEHNVIENEDRPDKRAQALGDNEYLVYNSTSAEILQDLQGTGGPVELDESEDLQEGVRNNSENEETGNTEYKIDRVVDHDDQDSKLSLKVEWYGYKPEDATWEPIEQLPRSAVVTYFRRKGLPLPAQIAPAQAG